MKENDLMTKLINIGKVIVGLLIAILITLIIGVIKMYSTDKVDASSNNTQESEYNTNYDVSMFKEIKAKDLKKETKDKLSVVYIGRETCGWCAAFLPNLWDAQDEFDFKTLYIDLAKIIDFTSETFDTLDQDAFDILTNLTGEGYEDYMSQNFGATPMILIMEDNKIVSAQTGYTEYDSFKTLLNEAGIK